VRIGRWGEIDVPRNALERQLTAINGHRTAGCAVRPGAGAPRRVGRGAGSMIAQAAAAGLDTFVTGEGPHHTFFDAEELS